MLGSFYQRPPSSPNISDMIWQQHYLLRPAALGRSVSSGKGGSLASRVATYSLSAFHARSDPAQARHDVHGSYVEPPRMSAAVTCCTQA
jgi:hypothetical protein